MSKIVALFTEKKTIDMLLTMSFENFLVSKTIGDLATSLSMESKNILIKSSRSECGSSTFLPLSRSISENSAIIQRLAERFENQSIDVLFRLSQFIQRAHWLELAQNAMDMSIQMGQETKLDLSGDGVTRLLKAFILPLEGASADIKELASMLLPICAELLTELSKVYYASSLTKIESTKLNQKDIVNSSNEMANTVEQMRGLITETKKRVQQVNMI